MRIPDDSKETKRARHFEQERERESRCHKSDGDFAIATQLTRSVVDYSRREEATSEKAELKPSYTGKREGERGR